METGRRGAEMGHLTALRRSWGALPLRVKQFVLLLTALLVASAPGVYWAFRAATWFEQRDAAIVEQQTRQFLSSASYGWLNQLQSARTKHDQAETVAQLFGAIQRTQSLRKASREQVSTFRQLYVVLPDTPRIPTAEPPPSTEDISPFSELLQSPTQATLSTAAAGVPVVIEHQGLWESMRVWHLENPAHADDTEARTAPTAEDLITVGQFASHGGNNDRTVTQGRRLVGIPFDQAPRPEDAVGYLGHGWLVAEPEAMTSSARYRSVMIPATVTVIVALSAAILLGMVLQRVVVTPVQTLSDKMREVAITGDYSQRVPETRRDEMGQLQTGFNRMIARVEELTAGLEARVAERTHELDRANRELQRSNLDLDRFAYTVSHDLQEPLRNVTNIVHRLRSDWGSQLPPDVLKQIDALDQQCDREMKMVQRILFISKLGRGVIQQQPVDLDQTLTQILDSMRVSLEERGIIVEVKPLGGVQGDAILLGEVLRNLVSNAAKYNDKPERRVRILSREYKAHGTMLIAVQDNGIGIRTQHLKKVFNLFTPLHDKRKFSETIGAGMAITKRIVERHGGKIRVVSVYGAGTSFFVRLPTSGVMKHDGTSSDTYR